MSRAPAFEGERGERLRGATLEQQIPRLQHDEQSKGAQDPDTLVPRRSRQRSEKQSIRKFKEKVKELTARKRGRSLYYVIRELNEFLRGWWGYCLIRCAQRVSSLHSSVRNRRIAQQAIRYRKLDTPTPSRLSLETVEEPAYSSARAPQERYRQAQGPEHGLRSQRPLANEPSEMGHDSPA